MYPCLPKGSLASDETEVPEEELDLAPSLLDLASPHQQKVLKWKASRSCSRSRDARSRQTKTEKFLNRNVIIKHALRKMSDTFSACQCSSSCCGNFISRIFPFLKILKGYSLLYDFPNDLVAGLTVGIMHIPQGKIAQTLAGSEHGLPRISYLRMYCEHLKEYAITYTGR